MTEYIDIALSDLVKTFFRSKFCKNDKSKQFEKENKIAQGDVNIFSHLTFFIFLEKNRSDKNWHHYQSV